MLDNLRQVCNLADFGRREDILNQFTIHPEAHVGPVHLLVADLQRSLQFYNEIIGFKILQRDNGYACLSADGKNPLLALTASPRVQPRSPHAFGLYHFAVLVPSRIALARSLHRLLEMIYPLQGASDHLVSEAIYLADPDGNGIEIYADRPREEWLWYKRQVQMETHPLDLDFLLAELGHGKITWHGLEPETRIGHVHLQVSDLYEAEQFYRQTLGFEVTARYGSGAVFLSAGGYHHHIGLNNWAGADGHAALNEIAGMRYFMLCMPDEKELARLNEHLRRQRIEFKAVPGQIGLADPVGNHIIILAGEATVSNMPARAPGLNASHQ